MYGKSGLYGLLMTTTLILGLALTRGIAQQVFLWIIVGLGVFASVSVIILAINFILYIKHNPTSKDNGKNG